MGVGIDLLVTIRAGESMEEFHLGMARYLMIGERITETIFGEVTHGTIIISARVICKDTGELGIKPTIGIDRSIENLRTLMMENRIVVGKESSTKVPRALKHTVQARRPKVKPRRGNILGDKAPQVNLRGKPIKANLPHEQKRRNEGQAERQEMNYPRTGRSERIATNDEIWRYVSS